MPSIFMNLPFIYCNIAFYQYNGGWSFIIGQIKRTIGGNLRIVGQLDNIFEIGLLVKFSEKLVTPKKEIDLL